MDTKLEEKKPSVKAKGKEAKENTTSGKSEVAGAVTVDLTHDPSLGSNGDLIENTSSTPESNDENEGAHILNTQETNPQESEAHTHGKSSEIGGVAGGLLPLMTPEELEEYMNDKRAIAAFSESGEELEDFMIGTKTITAFSESGEELKFDENGYLNKSYTKLDAASQFLMLGVSLGIDAIVESDDLVAVLGKASDVNNVQELDYPKLMGKDYLENLPATKQKERPTRSLTYGEKLAGVFDNPSDNEDLNRIKELAAEIIDIVAKNSSYKASETHSPEQLVFVGAINDVISAQQKCCKYIVM